MDVQLSSGLLSEQHDYEHEVTNRSYTLKKEHGMAAERRRSASVWISAAASATTLVTAALAGWGLGDLFRLCWFELIVTGFIALGQIRTARRPGVMEKSRGYQGIFFVAHFSTVCVMYLWALPWVLGARWEASGYFWYTVWPPALALLGAHLVSFRSDFLGVEAAATSAFEAMFLPYAREAPVQLPLIAAALVVPGDLDSTAAVVVFILGKAAADFVSLRVRHKRFDVAARVSRA